MLGRSTGAVSLGVEARLVEVEVDLGGGLPTIAAVGLPDSAVREGIDRIRSALRHSGFRLPGRRVVVNLAPAELPKHGSGLDLPIAVALLLADEQIPPFDARSAVMCGELGLDGSIRPVRGAFAVAAAARRVGRREVWTPPGNAAEAALIDGIESVPVSRLADVRALAGGTRPAAPRPPVARDPRDEKGPDLADVRGQASARRALEISAAGGHHLLLSGPPGAGKSMLARRLPGILPPLSRAESLLATRITSAAGLGGELVAKRPFRAPHHGISMGGLTGGGPYLRPGEMTLATPGVLYLDELTEFRRDALEALRQPLEDHEITLARARGAVTLPADFTLVASMNPCPCGYHAGPDGRCSCSPAQVRRYLARLSGPLLDRFDLTIEVPPVDLDSLADGEPAESSAAVRERVDRARARQRRRFGRRGPACNARMEPSTLARWADLGSEGLALLRAACERLGLSARGYDRVRRVARTLADLEGTAEIRPGHVAEALQYRRLDEDRVA